MRKTKLFMLLITIFVMSMTMGVFADDKTALTLNVSGDTAKNGEIIVQVDLSNNKNLGGLQAELTYDKTKLQYVEGAVNSDFITSAVLGASDLVEVDTGVNIAVSFNAPTDYNGTVAEMKFKVLAEGGETVAINVNSTIADIDYNEMDVENKPAEFNVKIPITSIKIMGEENITLKKGESTVLGVDIFPDNTTETNKNIFWTSSNESVVKADNDGTITAVGAGRAVITATSEAGGLTDQINVSVNVELEGIDIQTASNTIEEGKTLVLQAVRVPADATQEIGAVQWISSDEAIAKVDDKGIVTGVKVGEVKIIAKTAAFTKEITIKVTEATTEQQSETQTESEIKAEQESSEQKNTEQKNETTIVKENATTNSKVNTGDSGNTGIVIMMLLSIVVFGIAIFGKKYSIKK